MVILFPNRVYGDFYMTTTNVQTTRPSLLVLSTIHSPVRLLKRETRPSNPISDERGDSLSLLLVFDQQPLSDCICINSRAPETNQNRHRCINKYWGISFFFSLSLSFLIHRNKIEGNQINGRRVARTNKSTQLTGSGKDHLFNKSKKKKNYVASRQTVFFLVGGQPIELFSE